jgi:hypothetical protein
MGCKGREKRKNKKTGLGRPVDGRDALFTDNLLIWITLVLNQVGIELDL